MKNVELSPAAGWNIIFGLSIAAILGIGWLGFVHQNAAERPASPSKSLANSTALGAELAKADGEVSAKLWDVGAESVGSAVLDAVTRLAEQRRLKVIRFRSGRPIDILRMKEAPYTVVVEGDFPDVLSLVKSLEDPSGKLAISMLQVTALDGGSDRVNATFGLVGFLRGAS